MKPGSIPKVLTGVALSVIMAGGVATAATAPTLGPNQAQSSATTDTQSKNQTKKQYPNATRKSPEIPKLTKPQADVINKGLAAANAGNRALAKQVLAPYANNTVSNGHSRLGANDNPYIRSVALQALANLDYKHHNLKDAIAKLKEVMRLNALPNDTYFQLMFELAQFYAADGQYKPALDLLHTWRKEGRRETASSYGLEGVLNYRLQHYKAAITAINKAKTLTDHPQATWGQILAASYAETGQAGKGIAAARERLAANPKDAGTRHNLIVLLMNAKKYPEALKELENARTDGELNTSQGYMNLAKLHLMIGQNSGKDPKPYADKALAVLKDGKAKGILKATYAYYKLMGDAALMSGDTSTALDAYTKAAAHGKTGAADLMRAQLLGNAHQYSAARDAARAALHKGTKHKGRAYMMIAYAERAMKNKPAAVSAMKKAARDPETHKAAEQWLRKAGY